MDINKLLSKGELQPHKRKFLQEKYGNHQIYKIKDFEVSVFADGVKIEGHGKMTVAEALEVLNIR